MYCREILERYALAGKEFPLSTRPSEHEYTIAKDALALLTEIDRLTALKEHK